MHSAEDLIRLYFSRDRIARDLGIELVEFRQGYAKVQMVVEDRHLNGFDVAHGAALFAMADFAFAVAANSHGTVALGITSSMSFVKAVKPGVLQAEATETSLTPKLGTYAVTITDEDRDVVALFSGTSYRKKERIADYVNKMI